MDNPNTTILPDKNRLLTCFECAEGQYHEVVDDWVSKLSNGAMVITPDVNILRCNKCGQDCIGAESCEKIEANIEAQFPGYFKRQPPYITKPE